MKKIAAFSLLLIIGMILSQVLPSLFSRPYAAASAFITFLTMSALAFIMIEVGQEFEIDRSRIREYGTDYVVAMVTAGLPWLLVSVYFVICILPPNVRLSLDAWKEALLAGRFAAPTSAGILLAMLAAANLKQEWTYIKARILAVFDDLDTVLLLIPLIVLMSGFSIGMGINLFLIVILLGLAWFFLHILPIPTGWKARIIYAVVLAGVSNLIHLEVVLLGFVLGCIMKQPKSHETLVEERSRAAHRRAEFVSTLVKGLFMVLVGLSMPVIGGNVHCEGTVSRITATQETLSPGTILLHVVAITILGNMAKVLPFLWAYKHRTGRERLALSLAMLPRGEVGAGVLMISMGYGLGGPIITVAMLSLAGNLVLTGVFILCVTRLLNPEPLVFVGRVRKACLLIWSYRTTVKERLADFGGVLIFQSSSTMPRLTETRRAKLAALGVFLFAVLCCPARPLPSGNWRAASMPSVQAAAGEISESRKDETDTSSTTVNQEEASQAMGGLSDGHSSFEIVPYVGRRKRRRP